MSLFGRICRTSANTLVGILPFPINRETTFINPPMALIKLSRWNILILVLLHPNAWPLPDSDDQTWIPSSGSHPPRSHPDPASRTSASPPTRVVPPPLLPALQPNVIFEGAKINLEPFDPNRCPSSLPLSASIFFDGPHFDVRNYRLKVTQRIKASATPMCFISAPKWSFILSHNP